MRVAPFVIIGFLRFRKVPPKKTEKLRNAIYALGQNSLRANMLLAYPAPDREKDGGIEFSKPKADVVREQGSYPLRTAPFAFCATWKKKYLLLFPSYEETPFF